MPQYDLYRQSATYLGRFATRAAAHRAADKLQLDVYTVTVIHDARETRAKIESKLDAIIKRGPVLQIGADGHRALLRDFLASDPKLGGVNVQQLANRLYARGLRAPVKP